MNQRDNYIVDHAGKSPNHINDCDLKIHLGPVNTNRISIDGTHFFTEQGALSVVYSLYISESATQLWEKWVRPEGLALK